MKKIILAAALLVSINAISQDTTKIKGLQLQTRLIEYLIPMCMNNDNDSLLQVYIDLRPKFRIANPPTGTTLVTIDSIPTVELANLYNYALSNSDGMLQAGIMKTQIAAARTANSYLERLCAGYEAFWIQKVFTLRDAGRRILRGK